MPLEVAGRSLMMLLDFFSITRESVGPYCENIFDVKVSVLLVLSFDFRIFLPEQLPISID